MGGGRAWQAVAARQAARAAVLDDVRDAGDRHREFVAMWGHMVGRVEI